MPTAGLLRITCLGKQHWAALHAEEATDRTHTHTGRRPSEMKEPNGLNRDCGNRQVKHPGFFCNVNWGIWRGLTND